MRIVFDLKILFIVSIILLAISGCTKMEGMGGKATLTGTITVNEIDAFTGEVIDAYPAMEERVYIIYGDHDIYDDETRTHYDGRYKFESLQKGNYTLFVYSDCVNCPGGSEVIQTEIEITDRNETLNIPEIVIINQ